MSPHVKPSVSTTDEESGLGAWPPGVAEMRGGKKGDILKLVRHPFNPLSPIDVYRRHLDPMHL